MRSVRHAAALSLTAALLILLAPPTAHAQCILANPSFEIGGQGNQIFGGWNQFGDVGATALAVHGANAARVTGPDMGGWDVSAYWQPLDSEAGERWAVTVNVMHPGNKPLTGQSIAIVNVEWRDAADDLISFESYTAADASTPVNLYQAFAIETPPAPAGTVSARLVLGVLQSPDDPAPDVYFDQATFRSLTNPTDQWADFPGGRSIEFSGYSWRVKGPGFYGPGPGLFCDSINCVWVDEFDRLHMTVQKQAGQWYSSEITLEDPLGYGDYIFTTRGRIDLLDPNVVLGLFLWEYVPCYLPENGWWNPANEIDIEFSRWGNPFNDIGQFVAQPFDWPGNISRFDATFAEDEITSHAFRWLPHRVEYRSWRGGPEDEATSTPIHSWTYAGPHISRPEQPRVHINLWQFSDPAERQDVVLEAFTFIPDGPSVAVEDVSPIAPVRARLLRAVPNPFNPQTSIGYVVEKTGDVSVVVYDAAGRRVRRLVEARRSAGEHAVLWDGRDDAGRAVPSGVYLVQLRAGTTVESDRLVLVK